MSHRFSTVAGAMLATGLLCSAGYSAPAAKPTPTKAAPAKPVAVRKAAGASQEPPPGVQAQASASKKAAKPKAKSKPKAKQAAKKGGKSKKKVGASESKLKTGRGSASPDKQQPFVDESQLAVNYLDGAESKSSLELLAAYKATLLEGDLETAGVLLRLAAGEAPSRSLVSTVNELLNVPLDTQDTQALLELSAAARASAVTSRVGKAADAAAVTPAVSRIDSAHEAAANPSSGIAHLGLYRKAVLAENAEAAALALASVLKRPPDADAVSLANDLLGLESRLSPQQILALAPTQ